jgi:hypothetical protein
MSKTGATPVVVDDDRAVASPTSTRFDSSCADPAGHRTRVAARLRRAAGDDLTDALPARRAGERPAGRLETELVAPVTGVRSSLVQRIDAAL